MTEYTIGKAKVRVHGTPDPEVLRAATETFLKKAEKQRRERLKSNTAKNQPSVNAS